MSDYLNQLTYLSSVFGHQCRELSTLPELLRLPSKTLVAFTQQIYYFRAGKSTCSLLQLKVTSQKRNERLHSLAASA